MNNIIQVHHDKRHGGILCLIPMSDEQHSNMFENMTASATWVYYCDGIPNMNERINRTIPTIVAPPLADIWGGEQDIRDAGYHKHWQVFLDTETGKYYFGNYPQFIKSNDASDIEKALNMICVDVELLREL